MSVSTAIVNPTATIVLLAEVTAGFWARAWVVDGTYTNTYKCLTSFVDGNGATRQHTITAVSWNRSTALTERASAALVDANAGSWYHDGTTLWVSAPSGSIFSNVVQATVKFYFSDHAKVLNSVFWEPRLKSAPAISQRIEPIFGSIGQVGGGVISFHANDGFFHQLDGLQWDAGSVTLKLGVDLPSGDMAWADYETLATWRIDDWNDDGMDFQLKLSEPKARVKAKLPISVFNRTDYPNIEDENVGKPIPISYGANFGVAPICINPGTKTFKVAGHAIRSFDGVRLKKTRVELVTRSTDSSQWLDVSTDVRRYYISDETVKTITFSGTALTEVNDVDDVTSTAGRWAYVENYIYVRPQSGKNWAAGFTIVIESEQSSPAMVTTDFASIDIANGEFTLGDDWILGTDVAVDFKGKVSGSTYLENAIDIIQDLLTIAGETNLNTSSFTAARAKLKIGTDEDNNEVHVLRPSLYLTEQEDIVGIISDILKLARGYLYSDQTGQYTVGIFDPLQGDDVATIDDSEIISLGKSFDATDLVTKVIVNYQDRPVDGYAQHHFEESTTFQYIHDQGNAVISEHDLPTAFDSDANYWAEAFLCILGKPMARHEITVPWKFMRLLPGDQVLLKSDDLQIEQVYEVLEKRLDLGTKLVTLVVGNLRAFEDTPGFWVADSDVLPTRFSTLTGYSAGSLVWNASWDDEIKRWVRQNVGYWTDENGFATTSDQESFNTSTWI